HFLPLIFNSFIKSRLSIFTALIKDRSIFRTFKRFGQKMRNGIQESVSLQKLNTFGVQATAKSYVSITKESTLPDLYHQGVCSHAFFALRRARHVLFTLGYRGLLIHINTRGLQHFIEGNVAYVSPAGGEVWNDLVWYCVDHNFP